MRKLQSGVMLLEVLIAILIFSVGILGVVGMQASTIKASRDGKYRSEAGLLANELIGQMWSNARDFASLQGAMTGAVGSCGTTGNVIGINATTGAPCYDGPPSDATGGYGAIWSAKVTATLPGSLSPTVAITNPDPTAEYPPPSTVTITIFWRAPNDSVAHRHMVSVQII